MLGLLSAATSSKRALALTFGTLQVFLILIFWTTGSHFRQSSIQPNLPFSHTKYSSSSQHTSGPVSNNAQHAGQSQSQEEGSRDVTQDAQNRTLGFQKIFVINLPKRTDLRDSTALAASLTGLDIEFIDGVTEVDQKAWPPGVKNDTLTPGGLGCLRAHMNFLRIVVEQNLGSALVLEGDADWDVRIKSQMQTFAEASRTLIQPLRNSTGSQSEALKYLDPTYPKPDGLVTVPNLHPSTDLKETEPPTSSPYGDVDNWDVLWLGHCGMKFPAVGDDTPMGRAVIEHDETVPKRSHYSPMFSDHALEDEYPEQTRVVSRARMNTCTSAYAVSQKGARRLLYEFALHMVNAPYDLVLRSACHGSEGRKARTCLSVQPEIFSFHRPRGSKAGWSDIGSHGDENNEFAFSPNIRWSTKVNVDRLVDGRTDFLEQYYKGPARD